MLMMPVYHVSGHQAYDLPDPFADLTGAARAEQRAQFGLPADAFLFFNFNNAYKFSRRVLEAWAAILRRAPNSKMVFLRQNGESAVNLPRFFSEQNVSAERLVFVPYATYETYFARLTSMDVALDCIAYNGGTTGLDVLAHAVPMISLAAEKIVQRMGTSFINALGVPELIVRSMSEYEDLAVVLASDTARYRQLRSKMRAQQHRMSTKRWVKGFETSVRLAFDTFSNRLETAEARTSHVVAATFGSDDSAVPTLGSRSEF
jgi:predicted O-linked N-acetylglucosamine transferase (SPINDLY family)